MISYYAPQCPPTVLVDTFERTASTSASTFEVKDVFEETRNLFAGSRFLTAYRNVFCSLSERLDALRDVARNWNSYGSPPPSEVAIANAKMILQSIQTKDLRPENVHASGDGGVAFSFVSDTISRAAIECVNGGESYVLLYDLKGNSETLDWPQTDKGKQFAIIECLSAHLRSAGFATNS